MERHKLFRKDRQKAQGGGVGSVSMANWSAWTSVWGWMRSSPRAYGSGLDGGQGQVTL